MDLLIHELMINSFSDVRAYFPPGIFMDKEKICAGDDNGILGSLINRQGCNGSAFFYPALLYCIWSS